MNIEINEDGLTIINGKYGPLKKFQTFYAKRSCGCCTVKLQFRDEAAIISAFKKAGLDACATITDDAGTEHQEIDTFYRYSRTQAEQDERGIGYLASLLS
jgi:IS30 family transposase